VPTIDESKKLVGAKFIFQLPSGRNLPAPIQKLAPADVRATTKP
jgi:hypothetical protein